MSTSQRNSGRGGEARGLAETGTPCRSQERQAAASEQRAGSKSLSLGRLLGDGRADCWDLVRSEIGLLSYTGGPPSVCSSISGAMTRSKNTLTTRDVGAVKVEKPGRRRDAALLSRLSCPAAAVCEAGGCRETSSVSRVGSANHGQLQSCGSRAAKPSLAPATAHHCTCRSDPAAEGEQPWRRSHRPSTRQRKRTSIARNAPSGFLERPQLDPRAQVHRSVCHLICAPPSENSQPPSLHPTLCVTSTTNKRPSAVSAPYPTMPLPALRGFTVLLPSIAAVWLAMLPMID